MGDPEFFDRWAASYDRDVAEVSAFPFEGYGDVLKAIHDRAGATSGAMVLDLGTGTGNVAARFLECGCTVWATDSSPRMLELARAKFPAITFAQYDLREGLPASFPARFDVITSAYVFHHFDLAEKTERIRMLARDHLRPGGRLLLADIAFATVRERDVARQRFADCWDADEWYWAADEMEGALTDAPLTMTFAPVSSCSGVFTVMPVEGKEGS